MSNQLDMQRAIVEAVRQRGYIDPWTAYQHAGRQSVKLVEESLELLTGGLSVQCKWTGAELGEFLAHARKLSVEARALFDKPHGWSGYAVDPERIVKEAADVTVVLCCLLAAVDPDVDLLDIALAKARGDVERGKR